MENIKKELEKLENKLINLKKQDYWDSQDYRLSMELSKKINLLIWTLKRRK